MKRPEVVYIISSVMHSRQFEWVADALRESGVKLAFILLNPAPSPLEERLHSKGFAVKRLPYHSKSQLPVLFFQLVLILFKWRPRVVHTHLFEASLSGLTAAWLIRVPKRIYTRHHSSLHHDYFPNAVKWDKWCNKMATLVIAPGRTVEEILVQWEEVSSTKVRLIHHGFYIEEFENVASERVQILAMKYKMNALLFPVIGCIARYTEWKGVHFVIEAFAEILKTLPQARLMLANAGGNYSNTIRQILQRLPPHSYLEIDFEEDTPTLYQLFDVYVHAPINPYCEAFGQTYVEALAAGIPSVFTLSGVAREFIVHEENAWVVNFADPTAITEGIMRLVSDHDLAEKLINNGKRAVQKQFSINSMISSLLPIYQD